MPEQKMTPDLSRKLLLVAGTICVGLGALGMFLPILPTTPFLLLAAFCYARSSKRFYDWLITNRWFGSYISAYRAGLGIPLKQKVLTLLLLWLSIGYAAGFVIQAWWGKLLLTGIAAGVTVHLLTTKTYKPPVEAPSSSAIVTHTNTFQEGITPKSQNTASEAVEP